MSRVSHHLNFLNDMALYTRSDLKKKFNSEKIEIILFPQMGTLFHIPLISKNKENKKGKFFFIHLSLSLLRKQGLD